MMSWDYESRVEIDAKCYMLGLKTIEDKISAICGHPEAFGISPANFIVYDWVVAYFTKWLINELEIETLGCPAVFRAHLEVVVRKYPYNSFIDKELTKAFLNEYLNFLKEVDEKAMFYTGTKLVVHRHR